MHHLLQDVLSSGGGMESADLSCSLKERSSFSETRAASSTGTLASANDQQAQWSLAHPKWHVLPGTSSLARSRVSRDLATKSLLAITDWRSKTPENLFMMFEVISWLTQQQKVSAWRMSINPLTRGTCRQPSQPALKVAESVHVITGGLDFGDDGFL